MPVDPERDQQIATPVLPTVRGDSVSNSNSNPARNQFNQQREDSDNSLQMIDSDRELEYALFPENNEKSSNRKLG